MLAPDVLVPQVGQGAIAVECRAGDRETVKMLSAIEHRASRQAVDAERAFLAELGGDCNLPAGAHATDAPGGGLELTGLLASIAGRRLIRDTRRGRDPQTLGRAVARHLLDDRGGRELLGAPMNPPPLGTPPMNPPRARPHSSKPLAGLRIVVCRPREQAKPLADGLTAAGAEVVSAPVIAITDPADGGDALRDALARLQRGDWLMVTSPNGAANAAAAGKLPDGVNVAAIGPGTAERAIAAGLTVCMVPDRSIAEGLLQAFPALDTDRGRLVVLARAAVARSVLPDGLRAAGWEVLDVAAYRNVAAPLSDEQRRAVAASDGVVFTSSSTVNRLWPRSVLMRCRPWWRPSARPPRPPQPGTAWRSRWRPPSTPSTEWSPHWSATPGRGWRPKALGSLAE